VVHASPALPAGSRHDWWEDAAKVEALSALAAWVARYDSGQWDDPPGKLALLHDLERVRELVRGHEPFDPARDHAAFARFLVDEGCRPPPGATPPPGLDRYA
jgi:predicted RNA-binding Zn ribbon-like protein